jgi:hypothetical protein
MQSTDTTDELMKPWGRFSLSNDEDLDVEISAVEVKKTVSKGNYCVVDKLVSDHLVSKETIKTKFKCWWRPFGEIEFKVMGDNLFMIVFEDGRDKVRVLKGRPWVFEGNLFLVEDFDGSSSPAKLNFEKAFSG